MATRFERSLKSFLRESTLAYASGDINEEEIDVGFMAGTYSSRGFTMTDTYRVGQEGRIYSGIEEVTLSDEPVWRAAYTGNVLPHVPKDDIADILGVFKRALKKPTSELPIRGPRQMEIGGYKYKFESTHGPMTIARFAVIEEITKDGGRLYRGDISGGLM